MNPGEALIRNANVNLRCCSYRARYQPDYIERASLVERAEKPILTQYLMTITSPARLQSWQGLKIAKISHCCLPQSRFQGFSFCLNPEAKGEALGTRLLFTAVPVFF